MSHGAAQAQELFEQAAAAGCADSMNDLALMLEPFDAHRSLALYQRAVELRHADARRNLARCSGHGVVVGSDYSPAP